MTVGYARPVTLAAARDLLDGRKLTVLAGATDLLAARRSLDSAGFVLDLTAVAELRGIADEGAHWRIGAACTWSAIVRTDLPPLFDALKQAARQIGGPQIQNAGTIGGNICNASPAADGVPVLMALDARVRLLSRVGEREIPLSDFILGPGRAALRDGEMLAAILVPKPEGDAQSAFRKLGARAHQVISIVSVAGLVVRRDGRLAHARIAVGAASPVAVRLRDLEDDLLVNPVVTKRHFADLSPIDDVRATAAYRLRAAEIVTRRLVNDLLSA